VTPEGHIAIAAASSEDLAMGLLRHRDDAAVGSRFQMRERMLSIGDDFWIETEDGRRAYHVDGKALRIRKTFVLEDAAGNEVAKLQERKLSVRDKMEIERGGRSLATVKKRLIGIRDRFVIDVEDGREMQAKGNLVDHEYEIERDGDTVASVSKRWFRIRDTYGVEIAPGEDEALILAVTVCIDTMSHERG
jgi:uncharacterized protein YxjI